MTHKHGARIGEAIGREINLGKGINHQPGGFRPAGNLYREGIISMKKILRVLIATLVICVASDAAAKCGLSTSHDEYEDYTQYTFYNSCDGSWSVWTYSDNGGYSHESSDGFFAAYFVNGF